MVTDHDSHYKRLFAHPELVRDLLLEFVPAVDPQSLEFSSLSRINGSYISDSGKARHDDMVWKVRVADQRLFIYLLLEFQSESDAWMVVRMQSYTSLLYLDLVKQKELAHGKLPPILPIVLYNGGPRWRAATDLADLLAPAPTNLRPYQSGLQCIVLDEGQYDAGLLDSKRNLVAALFRLEHSRTPQDMRTVVGQLNNLLSDPQDVGLRRDFAHAITWLLRRKTKDPTMAQMSDLTEIQAMLEERDSDWWKGWKQEGLDEGMQKGLQQGTLEGEAKVLQKLLTRRFGPLPGWVQTKVSEAAEEDLIRWAEELLDATTLDQLFA